MKHRLVKSSPDSWPVDSPKTITPLKTILDLEAASEEYQPFSTWFFRRAIRLRKLAALRPGGRLGKIYLRRSDIEAFLSRYRVAAIGERK